MSVRIAHRPAAASHASHAPSQASIRTATSAAKKALDAKFKNDGVVSLVGKPTVTETTKRGVVSVSGKVDVNALWGGDSKYTFHAKVNVGTGKIEGLRTKIFQST